MKNIAIYVYICMYVCMYIYIGHLIACYWQRVIMDAMMAWTCRLHDGDKKCLYSIYIQVYIS
jgi:hypothetical protein